MLLVARLDSAVAMLRDLGLYNRDMHRRFFDEANLGGSSIIISKVRPSSLSYRYLKTSPCIKSGSPNGSLR